MEIIKNPHFDFLGKARYFIALSALFILGGLALMLTHGLAYGVEFSGGTQLILHFQSLPAVDQIRAAIDRTSPGAVSSARRSRERARCEPRLLPTTA